jgi:hypothetical protein
MRDHARSYSFPVEPSRLSLHALSINLISNTSHAAAGFRPEGYSSGNGSGIEACQPGLIAGDRVGFIRIGVRSQAAPQEEFSFPFSSGKALSRCDSGGRLAAHYQVHMRVRESVHAEDERSAERADLKRMVRISKGNCPGERSRMRSI